MEKYDAFISYRHLPLDHAVASRLQNLLENSRLYKREEPLRIFRDQSELQTSNNLSRDLQSALLQSRYLIVVCSEQTRESLWCMEEIRLFKEAHHGSTEKILTLLVSGEPDEVFPEELLFEELPVEQSEPGTELMYQKVEIEPLSADVRAESVKKSLKKLKVEFLRIAAPILGCEFDDLYQRRLRQRRRNAAIAAGSAIAVLTAVLVVVSVAAYRTWISENRYKGILADSYAQEASQYAGSGKPQEALLYYTQALTLEPEQSSAAIGAALLLQEYAWPVLEEEETGRISGKDFLPVTFAYAGNVEKDRYLWGGSDGYRIISGDGKELVSLPQNYINFLSDSAGWWAFCDEENIFFYHPESEQEYTIPIPQETSGIYEESELFHDGLLPAAAVLNEERAVVACKGIVHIYSFHGQEGMEETAQADLSLAYPEKTDQQVISYLHEIYPSQDGSLALISSDSLVAFYDTEKLHLKASIQRYIDYTTGMDISSDNEYFALSYGTQYQGSLANPGGYFEVYSKNGELLFTSDFYPKEALTGISFYPENNEYLLVWSASAVHVWNWKEGKEIAAPVREENIRSAGTTKEGWICVDNRDETVSFYSLQAPLTEKNDTVELDARENYEKFVTYYSHVEEYAEVEKLDCGGEEIFRVCFGENWTATEMQSRDILLFDHEGQRKARITPEHNGNVVTLLTDSDMRYAVLILEETIAQADSFHFNTNSIVEIWDTSSLLMLTSLEWENKKIESACITEDGMLCWSIRGERDSLYLTVPSPDEEALRFLCNLSCLSLDEKQDIVCKSPGDSGFLTGNWGTFLSGWETERILPETAADDTNAVNYILQEMTDELAEAADYAQESWFQRCDALWQSLLDGEIPYRLLDMDIFYMYYFEAAVDQGLPERIEPGLEAYLELQSRYEVDEEKIGEIEDTYSMYDILLSETLAYTQLYDEQIIRFLKETCESIKETEVKIPEDADEITRVKIEMSIQAAETTQVVLQSWSNMLENNVQTAVREFPESCLQEPLYTHIYVELVVLELLSTGDIQGANELSEEWLYYLLQLDDDGSAMEQNLKMHLLWGDILTARGMIAQSALEEYLRNIDSAVFGLKVMEVSPEAQEAGMRLDDLVISANGQCLADLYQLYRIRQDEGIHMVEVLRGDEIIAIMLPDSQRFGGKMVYGAKDS